MKIGIAYDGSMVIRDSENKLHIFCKDEARKISTACYKFAQNKKHMRGVYL